MTEPDSWEDVDEGSAGAPPARPSGTRLNANAPSFSFNPSAASFTPSFALPQSAPSTPSDADFSSTASQAGSTVSEREQPIAPPPKVEPVPPATPVVASQPAPSSDAQSSGKEQQESEAVSAVKSEVEELVYKTEPGGGADASVPDAQDPAATTSVLAEKVAVLDVKDVKKEEGKHADEEEEEEKVERRSTMSSEVDDRDHLNLVFIGHVDAGKSTIGGQILFLSNMVDERTIQKYEREAKDKNRESWYMAYIMDTNEEERAKGKTVEVGRAHFETEKKRYTILDAPGHKNYVPNMISGASQADVGVLVIAARKGEFETGFERGGQTREHAQLAKTLGVSKLVVVVNKMDDASVGWSQERFDEIVTKMTPFLKQCGYNTKKDVQFLPISGLFGTNVKTRMGKDVCPWWDGPCFFETLDALDPPDRDPNGPFRMPLIDKYRDMGTVVMGKIESGTVHRGDALMIMPNKAHVKVVAIFRDNDEVEMAKPGENLRIRLTGVEEEDISSGFVLSSISRPIPAVVEFDAQLQVLELLDHKAIFTAGYKAVLHIHSIVEECEIIDLLQQIDPKTKKPMKKKPLFVKSNAVVHVRLQVNEPICVEKFSDIAQLGRFTLRDEGKTVAIGKVMALPSLQSSE